MIVSFRDDESHRVFYRERSGKLPADIQRIALHKLVMLDAAVTLADLRVPPGNRLEVLSGNHRGQHSIRNNRQWRVCFIWENGGAHQVEITDYH